MNISWDAREYERGFSSVPAYGAGVIDLRGVRPGEKRPFDGMEPGLADAIVAEAVDELRADLLRDGTWHADYVRLRMRAVRGKGTVPFPHSSQSSI